MDQPDESPKSNLGLPEVNELTDDDRIRLIVKKTKELVKELLWFVVSDVDEYPNVEQRVSQVNRLLSEVVMHYRNYSGEMIGEQEYHLFDLLENTDTGNPAELLKVLLPLYTSIKSKKANEFKVLDKLGSGIQVKILVRLSKQEFEEFLNEPTHEKLLKLAVTAHKLYTALAGDNLNIKPEHQQTAVVNLKIEQYVERNFLNRPQDFDIDEANELFQQLQNLSSKSGLDVQ